MSEVNWDEMAEQTKMPASDKVDYKLHFYAEDGSEADHENGKTGVTNELEYVAAEQEASPKFPDPKGRPIIKFQFIDTKEGQEKTMWKPAGSRFFEAFAKVKPKPGDRLKIKRAGKSFETMYGIEAISKKE